jgi:SAM-dependent methyltransferase
MQPINFDLVADIYDIYVDVTNDIPFFIKETEGIKDDILELMCGTGRVTVPLLKENRKLVCVDYSSGMLDALKAKVEGQNYEVEIIKADITKMILEQKFKMILLPFHSLSEILEPEKQHLALMNISSHLADNGTFICTLQNPKIRLQAVDGIQHTLGVFPISTNNKLVVSYINNWDEESGLVTGYQNYEILDNKNNFLGKRILEINFRPISDTQFRNLIKDTGLEITDVYGDYSYSPFDEEKSSFIIYKMVKK